MSNDTKLETALLDLQYALLEKGVELEFIKVNAPVEIHGLELSELQGTGIKQVISERDAQVWS
jgi:hypothetical protein